MSIATTSGSSAQPSLKDFVTELEVAMRVDGVGWCSLEKATTLAGIIFGLRPSIVVELGVWMGGSAIPMAIALRQLGVGQLVAVDAWSADASVAGQEEVHSAWWGEKMGQDGHVQAHATFMTRLQTHSIPTERCVVVRKSTDAADVPAVIDVLHHDANHGPQVVIDIERWAPAVRVGGMLVIDDLDWAGGHVIRARDRALELGFVELYSLGTGCVLQRICASDQLATP